MRPYHGSNVGIERIDLSLAVPFKDFGRGFYLTSMPEQAERMALRIALEFKRASDQYSFHTERAIARLTKCGAYHV